MTAELSDGNTAFHVDGDHGPWVVLVHGMLTPGYSWAPLAEALAANGFRVLRYDQFGRGLSDRPDARYDLGLYVKQLRELAEVLGIDSMHIVAWSMGALIATRFAAERADSVDSLAMIAPALYWRQPPILRTLLRLPGAHKLVAWGVGDVIGRMQAEHLSRPAQFPDYTGRARAQLAFPGVGRSFASTIEHFDYGAGDQWRAVGQHGRPVLLVWGDSDRVTPLTSASQVMELFPRASLVTVEGAKHAPHLDHAEIVQPAILRHLASAENRPSAADEGADPREAEPDL